MRESAFALTAPALMAGGYSPLPILPPDAPERGAGKAPGVFGGAWSLAGNWNKFCAEQPSQLIIEAWLRMDARADHTAGIGIACGFGGLVAVDIDDEHLIDPVLGVIPPVLVAKIGRKGLTAFYRCEHPRDDERWWQKKNYRTADKCGLLDWLAVGSQTVLPPSIHPDTGEPYYWWTDATLEDTPLEALPVLTGEHRAAMEEVLRSFGWQPDTPPTTRWETFAKPTAFPDSALPFRAVNDVALTNLATWVPHLGLPKCHRVGGGRFAAVAEWRLSSTGRALHLREPNLSFHRDGIKDFGTGETYSPIDVVMEARRLTNSEALLWLAPLVGVPLDDPEDAALASRIITAAMKKKA